MVIEGGRQSGHLWQQADTEFLEGYGFSQFIWGEPCIFTFKRDISFLLMIVPSLTRARTRSCLTTLQGIYSNRFKSKISDQVDKFIGLRVIRNRNARTVTLSQELYIKQVDEVVAAELVDAEVNTFCNKRCGLLSSCVSPRR
eukprot:6095307-Pleurochrysis_carterae.AAC.1